MFCYTRLLILLATLLASSEAQSNSLSENVALFWNLYDSVVTGSRILHDVTEGVGAVSKAIKAIDTFLDTDAEKQLTESVEGLEGVDTPSGSPSVATVNSVPQDGGGPCDGTSADPASCAAKQPSPKAAPAKSTEPEMPKFNGCGALGFHIRGTNLPVTKMTDCCGLHDTCYSASCKANKRECDSKLRNCLFSVCEDKTVERTLKKSCFGAAKLLFSGTMALSFQQYNDAQELLKCQGSSREGAHAERRHRRSRKLRNPQIQTVALAEGREISELSGCEVFLSHVRDKKLPVNKMSSCCAQHAACYSSGCRTNTRRCDRKLKSCLLTSCRRGNLRRSAKKSCKATTKLIHRGTVANSLLEHSDGPELLKCKWKGDRNRRGR